MDCTSAQNQPLPPNMSLHSEVDCLDTMGRSSRWPTVEVEDQIARVTWPQSQVRAFPNPNPVNERVSYSPSDDKMLMVWDLSPSDGDDSRSTSPASSRGMDEERSTPSSSSAERAQPTAYVIPFPHPLTSVSSHPSTSKEFLVSDCRGSIYLTDWRSDPQDAFELGGDSTEDESFYRQHSVVELVEPHYLANSAQGLPVAFSGSVSWRKDSPEMCVVRVILSCLY